MSDETIPEDEAGWEAKLDSEQFRVLRNKGTEPAFAGKYCETKSDGTYACAGCGQRLFQSETKFESGTGWPSFFSPVNQEAITEIDDNSHGMLRTEVVCSRCQGHLGHVFPDGPAPTGLRYCLNSVSLDLVNPD
ncbi:MAG: peptide-methionine (R)-S-oxide reductase MsrB [Candidatus Hydrogenedentota bacterium]